jgi:hypothetical protein
MLKSVRWQVYGLMESLPEKEKAEWARVEDEMFQIKSKVCKIPGAVDAGVLE